MPLISERMGVDHSGMEPAPMPTPPMAHFPPETPQEPGGSGFTRCPLPPIYATNPDSLRQFYKSGRVPQTRIYSQQLKGPS